MGMLIPVARGHGQTEHPGSLGIYHHLELGRLCHRQVRRLGYDTPLTFNSQLKAPLHGGAFFMPDGGRPFRCIDSRPPDRAY
jgi:hypothetical protein